MSRTLVKVRQAPSNSLAVCCSSPPADESMPVATRSQSERTLPSSTKEVGPQPAQVGTEDTNVNEEQEGGAKDSLLFDPSCSAYELLGLCSVEPTARPPLLPMSERGRDAVAWTASDCDRSSWMLSARPPRALSGGQGPRPPVRPRCPRSRPGPRGASPGRRGGRRPRACKGQGPLGEARKLCRARV